jgi:hypothetical protein
MKETSGYGFLEAYLGIVVEDAADCKPEESGGNGR